MGKQDISIFEFADGRVLSPPADLTGEKAADYVAVLLEFARMGGVSVEEREFIAMVQENLAVDSGSIEQGRKKAAEKEGALGEMVSGIEDSEYRVCLFRDAYLMCRLNDGVDNVEWQVLERLSGALGLSTSLAKKIVSLVDDLLKMHQDYLAVLDEAGIG